jgi:hypothetical protein
MNRDLEIARKRLVENGFSISIVKRGDAIFESRSNGLRDLFEAAGRLGTSLEEASVADRVVGKAAAFLLVYSHVNSVFAVTISERALSLLKENSILIEFENTAPSILDKAKTDVCPFEKMILNCEDPEEAFHIFRRIFQSK